MTTDDDLNGEQLKRLGHGYCPDCGYRGFVLGPRGGAAINIECGNLDCRARFNVTPFPAMPALAFAERIAKESEGGAEWFGPTGREQ
jgi:hypothetical protein